ncbi:MAG: TetR/AcrR family transcriptional regulator [Pseudomonadota bacterium]
MARAKRSAADLEAMRRRLIEAARAIIAEHGLSAVTARGLAAKLGWSVGAIYTVIPSIDAVTLEANAAELEELCEALEVQQAELTAAGAAPSAHIHAIGSAYLNFATARPRNWAAIFERDAEGEPPPWYQARQASLFTILERALSPITGAPHVTRRSARALWAALHGLLALSLAGHLARVADAAAAPKVDISGAPAALEDLHQHAQELIDTYLAGLEARLAKARGISAQ